VNVFLGVLGTVVVWSNPLRAVRVRIHLNKIRAHFSKEARHRRLFEHEVAFARARVGYLSNHTADDLDSLYSRY
jgi:hypothetical protein